MFGSMCLCTFKCKLTSFFILILLITFYAIVVMVYFSDWKLVNFNQFNDFHPQNSTIQFSSVQNEFDFHAEMQKIAPKPLNKPPKASKTSKTRYSDCQQRYMGTGRDVSQNIEQRLRNKKENTLCTSENASTIECFITTVKSHNGRRSSLCVLTNVMANVIKKSSTSHKLHIQAKCSSLNVQKMKGNYFSPGSKLPFNIDIVDIDGEYEMDGEIDKDIWDIWYIDSHHQCQRHVLRAPNHVGNPYHCYAHMERYFMIRELLFLENRENTVHFLTNADEHGFEIPKDSQNMTNIPNMFGILWPFTTDVINNECRKIRTIYEQNSYFMIEKLVVYHLIGFAKDSLIWDGPDFYPKCKLEHDSQSTQSPLLKRMQKTVVDFYSSQTNVQNEEWMHTIFVSKLFEIHLDGKLIVNDSSMNEMKFQQYLYDIQQKVEQKIYVMIFMATRIQNQDGKCGHRCLHNMQELKASVIGKFSEKYSNIIFIFGNPGTFGFETQYNILFNTQMFIGVHGAVFAMLNIIMPENTLKFEIIFGPEARTPHLTAMFDGFKSYHSYICEHCRQSDFKGSAIDVSDVTQDIFQFYSTSKVLGHKST